MFHVLTRAWGGKMYDFRLERAGLNAPNLAVQPALLVDEDRPDGLDVAGARREERERVRGERAPRS